MKSKWLVLVAMTFGLQAVAAVELAKIGNKAITDIDVKATLGGMPDAQKQQINQDSDTKMRIIDNMVVEEVFVQEAEAQGVTKDKEFTQTLERARRQILAQRFLQKNVQPKITDANVKAFFDKNKGRYSNDEVRAMHVLVKSEAEAKEVYQKAKGGEDFQVLAKKYSKDPSAAQNMGDLGFFTRSRMVKEFADKAFSLKPGEIGEPVKTPFGFHVIKLMEKRDGKTVNFAEIKDQVRGDFQNEQVNQLIEGLKKARKVSVNEANVKGFKL